MKILSKFVLFLLLIIVVSTMTIGELSVSLIPDWTQKNNFSCISSQSSTEPVNAFLSGLTK